jgi:ribosomal peptide maturation radical SAM protein 1
VKVTLAAMPWSQKDRPSAALAALAAYVREIRPGDAVTTRSEYLRVAAAIGFEVYDRLAEQAYETGELLYASLLYPEKADETRRHFDERETGASYDALVAVLDAHLDGLAKVLADADVVGLTTCFGQLFANLCLAQRIKRLRPEVVVVLGGSTVSARVGPSILAEYPDVDFVVQGEGERPFVGLLDVLSSGGRETPAGVLSRRSALRKPAALVEMSRMDDLPVPTFDEYGALADELGIGWSIAIEGSRGCWWDRTRRTGDPRDTCYFCNLNVQWNGYREKSVGRLVSEAVQLSDRHRNHRLFFLDNIIRARGVTQLATALSETRRHFQIFYEMRANIRPAELVAMWEAGLYEAQFGIEALSTSLLERVGKGTTTLQNLQVMKLCAELGIRNGANLIVDFPGSTTAEVVETVKVIRDCAVIYQPLSVSKFRLGVDSTVEALKERFGVANVRNSDLYKVALPAPVWQRLSLFDLDFDLEGEQASWAPVLSECEAWRARHARSDGPLLRYHDGVTYLHIEDRRQDEYREGTFEGLARDVYLYCGQIRSRDQIQAQFAGASAGEIDDVLGEFLEWNLIYEERGKCLALALAPHARAAAARVRVSPAP